GPDLKAGVGFGLPRGAGPPGQDLAVRLPRGLAGGPALRGTGGTVRPVSPTGRAVRPVLPSGDPRRITAPLSHPGPVTHPRPARSRPRGPAPGPRPPPGGGGPVPRARPAPGGWGRPAGPPAREPLAQLGGGPLARPGLLAGRGDRRREPRRLVLGRPRRAREPP